MLIHRRVEDSALHGLPFEYQRRCKVSKITHLYFADDLMLFCGKSIHSTGILSNALKEFSALLGLTPNNDKSCIFLVGRNHEYNQLVLHLFHFPHGDLPMRYLEVPLISTKLNASNYKPLIDSITGRISRWTSKLLSFAGRIQLI